jgi:hypothetical protein
MTLHEFGMDEGMTRNRIAGITVATREVTNASDLRVSIGRWVQKLWK